MNPFTTPKSDPVDGWADVARRLLLYARRLGASDEEAEDLVQDSLMVAVRDPTWHDRGRASLVTALSTVLRNRWVDRYRHRRTQDRLEPQVRLVLAPELKTPAAESEKADARACRAALLARLTPEERAVFRVWLLQRRGDVNGPTAAASIGLSYADYESGKKRLRRRVRALLEDLGYATEDLFDPSSGGVA